MADSSEHPSAIGGGPSARVVRLTSAIQRSLDLRVSGEELRTETR